MKPNTSDRIAFRILLDFNFCDDDWEVGRSSLNLTTFNWEEEDAGIAAEISCAINCCNNLLE